MRRQGVSQVSWSSFSACRTGVPHTVGPIVSSRPRETSASRASSATGGACRPRHRGRSTRRTCGSRGASHCGRSNRRARESNASNASSRTCVSCGSCRSCDGGWSSSRACGSCCACRASDRRSSSCSACEARIAKAVHSVIPTRPCGPCAAVETVLAVQSWGPLEALLAARAGGSLRSYHC